MIIINLAKLFYGKKICQSRWFTKALMFAGGLQWIIEGIIYQKILGINKHFPWPVSRRIEIGRGELMHFHPDDLNIFWRFGNYFQCWNAHIYIGEGTLIAPNVGIITANHNVNDLPMHSPGKDVWIGKNCWIGMNAMVLPGVQLGDHTIVGAGSVVTKSFLEGNCIIAGNPARIVKYLEDCGSVMLTK